MYSGAIHHIKKEKALYKRVYLQDDYQCLVYYWDNLRYVEGKKEMCSSAKFGDWKLRYNDGDCYSDILQFVE